MEVLNSINWSLVKFDVLCIETDPPNRPDGYAAKVTAFMQEKGYKDYSGQVGRNICKIISYFIMYCLVVTVYELCKCFAKWFALR